MSRLNELRMIARVAQMYHVEGRRQADIASHLRISQASVSRMLKKAVQEEIVRTSVVSPPGTYAELESGLRDRYGLAEAIVVECSEDSDGPIMARIGEAAAHFLEATLQKDEIIGVSSWSETILRMVDNIHPMKTGRAKYVVQTLGGIGDPSVQTHATHLTTRLARLTGADPLLLPAPGVAQSREAKLVMLSDPYVRETMDFFSRITLAIVGIGSIEPSRVLGAQRQRVFIPGAVGHRATRRCGRHVSQVLRSPRADRGNDPGPAGYRHVDRRASPDRPGHCPGWRQGQNRCDRRRSAQRGRLRDYHR